MVSVEVFLWVKRGDLQNLLMDLFKQMGFEVFVGENTEEITEEIKARIQAEPAEVIIRFNGLNLNGSISEEFLLSVKRLDALIRRCADFPDEQKFHCLSVLQSFVRKQRRLNILEHDWEGDRSKEREADIPFKGNMKRLRKGVCGLRELNTRLKNRY